MSPPSVGRVLRVTAFVAVASVSACVRDDWKYTVSDEDAGATSDAADAAAVRADVPKDRPVEVDAGLPDAGLPDAGLPDAGLPDAGLPDAGLPDASAIDTPDSGGPCPVAMVQIPAGQFLMGDSTGVEPLSLPVHAVRVSAFCLDVAEVTVDAYRSCPSGTCTSPGIQPACNWSEAGRGNHPINCVTFAQAQAYCAWRDRATLPTEAQWEYAARGGVDGRLYPWGNTAPSTELCWSGGGTVQPSTCAASAFPASASFGLFDMAGGVSEMTLDWYGPYFGNTTTPAMDPPGPATGSLRIIRGGSWRSSSANDVRVFAREGMDATYATATGFRCAKALP